MRSIAGVASAVVASDHNGDATSNDQNTVDGTNVQIYLPNGRRTTAHVIEAGAEDMSRGESGLEEDTSPGNHPGRNYESGRLLCGGLVGWA